MMLKYWVKNFQIPVKKGTVPGEILKVNPETGGRKPIHINGFAWRIREVIWVG
jgi:hypothetical protein